MRVAHVSLSASRIDNSNASVITNCNESAVMITESGVVHSPVQIDAYALPAGSGIVRTDVLIVA